MGWNLFTELGEEPFDVEKFEMLMGMLGREEIDFVGICRRVDDRHDMFLNIEDYCTVYDLTLEVTAETGDHIYEKEDVSRKEMMEEVIEPLLKTGWISHPESFRHTFRRKGEAAPYAALLEALYADPQLPDLYRQKTAECWYDDDFASAMIDLLWEQGHLAAVREDADRKEFEHDISYLKDLPEHLKHVDGDGPAESWLAAIRQEVRKQGNLIVCLDIDNPGFLVTMIPKERLPAAQSASEKTGITVTVFPE